VYIDRRTAKTYSKDVQQRRTAKTYSKDVQQRRTAKTYSKDVLRRRTAKTWYSEDVVQRRERYNSSEFSRAEPPPHREWVATSRQKGPSQPHREGWRAYHRWRRPRIPYSPPIYRPTPSNRMMGTVPRLHCHRHPMRRQPLNGTHTPAVPGHPGPPTPSSM
jgi:hypothetical protein